MHLYQAIILAIIQGITEFLPVSSTAHLILFPWLAGWPDPGLAFDVALHMGTLLAVFLYFLRDWVELVAAGIGFRYPRGASYEYIERQRKMFWYIVAGTIPAAVVGALFQHQIEDRLRQPLFIAGALIVVGLLMWYGEYAGRLDRPMERVNFVDAMAIGVAQAFALFPGVSRSGITITAGLFRGMTREAAARFSFILSTPVIAGAAAIELPKL
ncbi:MAG: undecaprenyl-diphosphate phosphatase, partial [Candidatus Acidiferrales bacterium]